MTFKKDQWTLTGSLSRGHCPLYFFLELPVLTQKLPILPLQVSTDSLLIGAMPHLGIVGRTNRLLQRFLQRTFQ